MGKNNQSNKYTSQTNTATDKVNNENTGTNLGGDEGVSSVAGSGNDDAAGAVDTSNTSTDASQDAAGAAALDDGEAGTKEDAAGDAGAASGDVAGAAAGTDASSADPDTGTTDTGAAMNAGAVTTVSANPADHPSFTAGVAAAAPVASVTAFAAAVSDTIAKEAAASGIVMHDLEAETAAASFYENRDLSTNSVSWLRRLEEYITEMDPAKPMDHSTGVPHQKTLYRVLSWVINSSPDDEFMTLMGLVLQQFDKHSAGVFHETAVNRFPEHLTLNPEERTTFFQLLNLMNIGADVKGREQRLKQLDFNRMFIKVPLDQITEQGRQRILGYFGK